MYKYEDYVDYLINNLPYLTKKIQNIHIFIIPFLYCRVPVRKRKYNCKEDHEVQFILICIGSFLFCTFKIYAYRKLRRIMYAIFNHKQSILSMTILS